MARSPRGMCVSLMIASSIAADAGCLSAHSTRVNGYVSG
jgi:hypothetical protein